MLLLVSSLGVWLGFRDGLMVSELDAECFYPHVPTQFSGLPLGGRWTFSNGFTLHFCEVWTAASIPRLWRVREWMSGGEWFLWMVGVGIWAAVKVAGLVAWFGGATAECRMEQHFGWEGMGEVRKCIRDSIAWRNGMVGNGWVDHGLGHSLRRGGP